MKREINIKKILITLLWLGSGSIREINFYINASIVLPS